MVRSILIVWGGVVDNEKANVSYTGNNILLGSFSRS